MLEFVFTYLAVNRGLLLEKLYHLRDYVIRLASVFTSSHM